MDIDALIAKLARFAAASDNGVSAGHQGLLDVETRRSHEGSAKAYRHAISLVIQAQRSSNALQCESEQKIP